MKKILLILLTALVYLVSFKVAADATSYSPYDVPAYTRDYYNGYFSDSYDSSGDDVLQNDANDPSRGTHYNGGTGAYDAIPPYVDTPAELIGFILGKLNSTRVDFATANNATNWDRTGAAFLIQTMIGTSRNRPPTAGEIAEWQARIYHAAALGHLNFHVYVSQAPNTFYQISRWDGSSYLNDVAWFSAAGTGDAIVFWHDDGSQAYVIRRNCANPVGGLSALSDDVNFNISASSAVNNAAPIPNQTIQFTHSITSSNSTGGNAITWTTQNMPSGTGISSSTVGPFGGPGTVGVGTENYLVPLGTPAGTQVCRRVAYSPANQGGGSGASGQVCATVQYAYDLNPTVLPSSTNAQDGDTITFTYRIQNVGGNGSVGAQCYVRDGGGAAVAVPLTCSGSQVFPYNSGVVTVGTENVTISGQPAGTRICRTLYIQPATPSVPNRASTQSCTVVSKTPYVRFSGNDVWAGGGFPAVTPACNISAKITTAGRALPATLPVQYAGSSVEYSAYALNRITSFGSAGKVLVGSGVLGDLSRSMTFANNEASASLLGYYGASQHCLQDYSSLYGSLPVGGALAITSPTSGAWHSASFPSLSGAAPAGVTKVYYSDGDVTITGNITYPASYANVSQIPSILVIAKGNIYVAPGVTQMDGQYVTRGTFYTCYPKPVPNSVSNCNNLLTVNGSVIANALDLYRTSGGDGATIPQRQAPAEVFNFVPEVYIRNVLLQTAKPSMQVLNSIELPPRF